MSVCGVVRCRSRGEVQAKQREDQNGPHHFTRHSQHARYGHIVTNAEFSIPVDTPEAQAKLSAMVKRLQRG